MSNWATRSILLAATFALAGCGGGGGGGPASVGSLPPPAPPPPPPPPAQTFILVPAATTSQQFAVAGASFSSTGATPKLDASDQLQVRYVQSSNSYEVELPGSQTWIGLTGKAEGDATGGGIEVVRQYSAYQYSSLFNWFQGNSLAGTEAIGIATAAGAVPVTGTATYSAIARGSTSESNSPIVERAVIGEMTFNFDFALGSLSGSFSPELDPEWSQYSLGKFNFRDTVYSTGSTTFSGRFDTDVAGTNSFNGLFTGPNAQELIGNFAFPYRSPIDSKVYQVGGAFVGKK